MRYVFGECTLDTEQYVLTRAGRALPLQPKVFQVLHYLLTHRDRVIAKPELSAQVWPDQFISDATLEGVIKAVRQAVGDDGRTQWCIQTRRGQGYRFVASLRDVPPAPPQTEAAGEAPAPVSLARSAQSPVPPPQALPAPSRRQLTVLFCDLVDSTRLAGQLDPEDLREVIAAYHDLCTAVMQRFDGHIAQYLGDGLLVYFGYPQAHEDDAQRAVRSGLSLADALAALNTRLERERGVRLALRLGIHTGLVVISAVGGAGRQEPLALGDTPNIAARLQHLAAPNTVVMSEHTRRLVGGAFAVEDLGLQALPGVAAPLRVYRVDSESAAESRFAAASASGLTPLVGREEELGLLLQRWHQAQAGEGQVVLLAGEAGIGKSRLLQAFSERIAAEPHIPLRYQCSPYYRHSAFYPMMVQLERAARLERDESPAQKLAKLEALLAQATERVTDVAPLLAALLSIPTADRYPPLECSPQRQKEQTIEALADQVSGLARRHPVLLLFEDAHWSDPTSLDVLARLVHRVQDARVLAVITYRRQFAAPWTAMSHVTGLTLPRLSRAQSAAMIARITAGTALPQDVLDQLLAKTDGVPLFVEELTKTVLESGLLCKAGDHYALTGPLPPLAIPATVQDALMAQLDRLGPVKEVAQLGAVLGREFPYAVLAAVAPVRNHALVDALQQLVTAGLLFGDGHPPTARYRFKHALVRDAAYASLLKRTRHQLHARIAIVLEAHFPDTAQTQPELLAHHALQGEVWAKAVTACQLAGARAHERTAFREAVASFEQALQALAHLPDSGDTQGLAIELRLTLQRPLAVLGAYRRCLTLLDEAEALARARDDRARLGAVLAQKANILRVTGDLDGAVAVGQQALALATALRESALQVYASHRLGQVYYATGDFGQAVELLRWSVEVADRECGRLSPDMRIESRAWLARALSPLGAFTEGRCHGEEALRLATPAGRGQTPIVAHGCLGLLSLAQGDLERAVWVLEQGLAFCRASGNQNWLPGIAAGLGYAAALQGRLAEGRTLLEEAMSENRRTGARPRPFFLAWFSEVCRLAGRGEEARQYARQAVDLARQHKEHGNEALALHQCGVVHAHVPPADAAQAAAHYQQALALAEALGMRPLVAHCHHGLGRLYGQTGRREQARTALTTAITLYRAMDMTFWLPEAEAALAQVNEG
jgi:class 3 adenylate cyclase/tetratricopeptide (TPR) repeat protein